MSGGPRPSWAVAVLRAAVYALTAGALAFPLTAWPVVQGAALGAFVGGLLAQGLAGSRIRLPAGLVLILATAWLASWVTAAVLDLPSLARELGSETLLICRGAATWALGAGAGACALGLASLRVRLLGVLEVAAVLGASAALVAEHRFGAIHRPFELADPILVRGGDPTLLFLGVGVAAALLMAVTLIQERRFSRLLVHVALLAIMALGAFGLSEAGGIELPRPDPSGAGRRDEGKGEADRKRRGGPSAAEDLEFRDDLERNRQQAPVAVVLFHDDYSPPSGVYYFRQNAHSQFNGRRLVIATREGVDKDLLGGFATLDQAVAEPPDAGMDRTTLETTVALLADHSQPFALASPVRIVPAENPNPERFLRVYRATSAALTSDYPALLGLPAGAPDWTKAEWEHYTRLPDDPRYAQLAQQILEPVPEELRDDPMLKAWTVRDWLGKEGTYSLRSQHARADDPTADFLFGDKTGYCVHFAHAATFLMRALGVPARVGTGYMADESARQGGSALLLHSGNAHAWPEIYLDGVGWVVVDVYPERTLDPPVQPPDADLQRLLGQLARGARILPADGSPPPETFAQLWRWLSERLLVGFVSLLLGTLLLLYGTKLWRALAPRFASPAKLPRVTYRAGLDRLSELGLRRKRGETREAFARRVATRLPSFQALTQAHLAAAFGSRRGVEPATLRAQARSLGGELGASAPVHRRLLGWLTPWSFWGSR